MKLYHAGISSCSQKVRIVLAEKALSYDSQILDLQAGDQFDPAYVALNPNAVVPTLEDGGRVYIESALINEYLDDAYPDVPLKPTDAGNRHLMRLWTKKTDALHASCGVATYAIGVRPGLLNRPKAEVDALIDSIPDAPRRSARRSVVDHGVEAPEFAVAMSAHRAMFDEAQAHLANHRWLAGDQFSLADANMLPYVLRVEHLGLGALIERRGALADWLARVQARESYEVGVGQWLPDAVVKSFQKAGAAVADKTAALIA